MLSDVLIVVMYDQNGCTNICKRLQKTYSAGKNIIKISWFYLQKIIYTDFEDNDFNCTSKFCYQHGNFHNTEAATGGVLKIQIRVSQNLPENTYASVSFLIKLQG